VLVHWRARRRDRHVFSEALLTELAETTEAAIETAEVRMAALETCIAALPDRQRELIRLFYGENQAADAIARRWDRSVHAVYKALKVMRKALLDCVTKKLSILIDPSGVGFESRPAIS
jgi:RNA polymerase sigma-70 factor (ECF subfamily)